MAQIRVVYNSEPSFPATAQHPDAVRYQVGGKWVDAIGGQPTLDEVNAVLNHGQAGGASAMLERQRTETLDDLNAAIAALPAAQQQAFTLIKKLLEV